MEEFLGFCNLCILIIDFCLSIIEISLRSSIWSIIKCSLEKSKFSFKVIDQIILNNFSEFSSVNIGSHVVELFFLGLLSSSSSLSFFSESLLLTDCLEVGLSFLDLAIIEIDLLTIDINVLVQ